MKKALLFCLMLFIPSSLCRAKPVCICLNADLWVPQVEFAVKQIREALQKSGYSITETNADTTILLKYDANDLEPQCYSIRTRLGEAQSRSRTDETGQITVTGGDATGLMYGGLELAEMIRLDKGVQKVKDTQGKPYIKKRGLKFNIPLDARTPSYDDTGDAAQENYAEMWNFEFWKEFLDNMARHPPQAEYQHRFYYVPCRD